LKCEICGNREAVYNNRLCENCAEGITRLVKIELPEKWRYFAVAAPATPLRAL
jgi:hypothetical protein